ncbi:hypothetical protein AB6A40_011650, partial [Gnathostoma spinigerum]
FRSDPIKSGGVNSTDSAYPSAPNFQTPVVTSQNPQRLANANDPNVDKIVEVILIMLLPVIFVAFCRL